MKQLIRLKQLNRNHFFFIGFMVGLILTICLPDNAWEITEQECPETMNGDAAKMMAQDDDFEPHLNLVNKPMTAKKTVKNIIRPRYYSSELGIREKLFVGVLTHQHRINSLATAFNRTTAHHVNRIKYFINAADNVRTNFKLKNIVGFTDKRERNYYIAYKCSSFIPIQMRRENKHLNFILFFFYFYQCRFKAISYIKIYCRQLFGRL